MAEHLPALTSGSPGNPTIYDFTGRTFDTGLTSATLHDVTLIGGTSTTTGFVLTNSSNITFQNWTFNLAGVQLSITGGNRATLAGSGCVVNGCTFQNCTNVYACQLDGVGHLIQNCTFIDCSARGLQIGGPVGANDTVADSNAFIRCATTTADCGAIYMGGKDCSQRGVSLTNNTFISIVGPGAQLLTWGIYLDDHSSGSTITGNVFVNCLNGIFINGGRDNFLSNNQFTNVSNFSYQLKDRNPDSWPQVANCLQDITSLPYAKYPYLPLIAASQAVVGGNLCYTGDNAAWPEGNILEYSKFAGSPTQISISAGSTMTLVNSTVRAKTNVGWIGNANSSPVSADSNYLPSIASEIYQW